MPVLLFLGVSNVTQSSHLKSNPIGASHLLRMMQDFALSRRCPMILALLWMSEWDPLPHTTGFCNVMRQGKIANLPKGHSFTFARNLLVKIRMAMMMPASDWTYLRRPLPKSQSKILPMMLSQSHLTHAQHSYGQYQPKDNYCI